MKKAIFIFFYTLSCTILVAQDWASYTTSMSDIPFDKVNSLSIGPSGEIWIGNDVSGNYYHASCYVNNSWSGHLVSNWVNDLATDNSGNLWLSTWGELRKWDGNSWTTYTPPGSSLGFWAAPVCAQSSGIVWLLDYSSLWKFDGSIWEEFTTTNSGLPSTSISQIISYGNTLYIATSDHGLVYYENGSWSEYNTSNSNIPDDALLAVSAGNNGIWVVCQSGELAKLQNGNFVSYSCAGLNLTKDMASDAAGNIWIATHGAGIIKYDGIDFTIFDNSSGGIFDQYNQYLSIEVDASNTVWVGSRTAGLLYFDQTQNNYTDIDPNKKLNIFFLGNSFTAANDLPGIVEELANEAGLQCFIQTHAPGGQFSTDHVTNPFVYETINSKDWDFVVIQDNQGAFVNQPPYVSPNYVNANTQLYDSIKANNVCTSVIWFAGWAAEGGYPTYFPGDNTQTCIERILANVIHLNNPIGEVVGPIGEGWIRSLNEQPLIDLYSTDGTHPSIEGSYLTASVLFSLMFKKNPTSLNYNAGINQTDAAYLRQTGYEVVSDFNNQEDYNITSITPYIEFDLMQLTTYQLYNGYQWLYDDNILVGETDSPLDYIDEGIYALYVLDVNYCQQRSFDQNFGPLTVAAFSYTENNGTVLFTNESVNSTSWDWNFGDGNYSVEENPTHTYLQSGSFTVSLTASGGTGDAIYYEEISITLAINGANSENNIQLYPNPSSDYIYIQNNSNHILKLLKLYDINGKLIKTYDDSSATELIEINIKDLNAGIYYISFTSDDILYKYSILVK